MVMLPKCKNEGLCEMPDVSYFFAKSIDFFVYLCYNSEKGDCKMQ